jgi:putative Mn2+ efflux pump MntP
MTAGYMPLPADYYRQMDILLILFLGISLAFDCFAVSLSAGSCSQEKRLHTALVLGSCFGVFQGGMFLAGFFSARFLVFLVSAFDHWVAFGILLVVGLKMVYEGIGVSESEGVKNYFSPETLVVLSLATSIDALGVGLSYALIGDGVVVMALVAGVVSFLFSVTGTFLGGKLSEHFGERFEIIGGLILIAIGIRIVLEHMAVF